MINKETKYSLKQIAESLLSEKMSYEDKKMLIDQVHSDFSEMTGLKELSKKISSHTTLPVNQGSALSVIHAADCLIDYHRTIQLFYGLHQAVKDKLEINKAAQVHVFYAGTGPFAPFVHLLAELFSEKELCFSLLEVNPDSYACCKQLVKEMGTANYVREFLLEDAVTYKIKESNAVDILFSETLDSLLNRESYVPILMNLKPQLSENAVVIPENVELKLAAVKEDETGLRRLELGSIFNVKKFIENPGSQIIDNSYVQCERIAVAKELERSRFEIKTEVAVYDGIELSVGESSISLPYYFESHKAFRFMNFTYDLWPNLELKCDFEMN